jgi:carboxymethylenebutenolidase
MKKSNLLLILMLTAFAIQAQELTLNDGITICHTSSTEKFALFVQDDDFNMSHPNPVPYIHVSETGKMITFKTPDGKEASGYVLDG